MLGYMKAMVIGGTGTVGSQVTAELQKRNVTVAVMSRSAEKFANLPPGVQGVVGDLQQPQTLPAAMSGVDAVFLATALAPDEINQGLEAVEAVKDAGVRRIVYMSVQGADQAVHIPHFATKIPIEYAVRHSGLEWNILRPNNFFQNDFWVRDAIIQAGVYPQPMSARGLNRVDTRDIAEAAAICLTADGVAGRTYTVAGPDLLTGEQVAATYARVLGRDVAYVGADLAAWEAAASQMMPRWMVLDLRIMYAHFLEHGLVASPGELRDLEALLGRPPRGFEAFVREFFSAGQAAAQR